MTDWQETLQVPDAVLEITRRLEDEGHETWAVGGAVRDALLGHPRSDWDLATAARPEVVQRLFRTTYPVGIEFGTVGVRARDDMVYEVTTFRRDVTTDGRHAVVEYSDDIDEDLGRRDFTLNAIAYHPLRGTLHDPFHGRRDLEDGILRSVGQPEGRFSEDYLRVLRGLRFAGRFQLRIEEATWTALQEAVPHLPRLSGERVREELLKVLGERGARRGLALYRESSALDTLLPELGRPDVGAWSDLLDSIDAMPPHRPFLRAVLLLAPAQEELESVMMRLRFSNAEQRRCRSLIDALALALPPPDNAVSARRWVRQVGRELVNDTLRLHSARARAGGASDARIGQLAARARAVRQVVHRDEPVALSQLAIDGDDLKALGLTPGPRFSRILDSCLDAVLEDPELNDRDALLDYVREHYLE